MMTPIYAKGNHKTKEKLIRLRKQAHADKIPRVALRIQGILLSLDKYTTGEISRILNVNRTTVPLWINNWNDYGEEALLEGVRSGRKPKLSYEDFIHLQDIIESGPVAYGLNTGVWTSPLITQIIDEEFGVTYHDGHVRKILKRLGFSVQRPTVEIVTGNPENKRKWLRFRYPNLKKKPKMKAP